MKIENLKDCTGCAACFNNCKIDAIVMKINGEGFEMPAIDHNKCIECGKCDSLCPALNETLTQGNDKETYAYMSNDYQTRMKSSSGGFFFELASHVLDSGGCVFGAKYTEDFLVIHAMCETKEELETILESKYVQSHIGFTYRRCKDELNRNRKVLFAGTPCQIIGLKRYLDVSYENLITMDFVCHGVPSPKFWSEYLKKERAGKKINKIHFRNKSKGWRGFCISIEFDNGEKIIESMKENKFYKIYQKNESLRESCYNCKSLVINSVAEFSVGDLWGAESISPIMYDDMGTSLVIVRGVQGKELFSKLSTKARIKKIDLQTAINNNRSIVMPSHRPVKRDSIYIKLEKQGIEYILKHYGKDPLVQTFKRMIRNLIVKLCNFV